jgi:hypothetical protein
MTCLISDSPGQRETPSKIATVSTRHDKLNGGYHGYITYFAADGSAGMRRLQTAWKSTMREAIDECKARVNEIVAAQPQKIKPGEWKRFSLYGEWVQP